MVFLRPKQCVLKKEIDLGSVDWLIVKLKKGSIKSMIYKIFPFLETNETYCK